MSTADERQYGVGFLVTHPRRPEWGPGRILEVRGLKVTVYFRDLRGDDPREAVKTIDTGSVRLPLAEAQADPFLDNLPPYVDGKFEQPVKKRVTLSEGLEKFRSLFPLYFGDPAYIGDLKAGERAYKWAAHQQFVDTLGSGQLRQLLKDGAVEELRRRALAVEGRVNLLPVFEKAAFRDGLKDDSSATFYFESLAQVLETSSLDQASFESYLEAVDRLPSAEGKTTPAKWTVATILPYLADPGRFMFLKPTVTQDCAARLTFDLKYAPQLNWPTYAQLIKMSKMLLDTLRQYGARDFIDVQSFIWVIGKSWD
jgi:hypothetical protein